MFFPPNWELCGKTHWNFLGGLVTSLTLNVWKIFISLSFHMAVKKKYVRSSPAKGGVTSDIYLCCFKSYGRAQWAVAGIQNKLLTGTIIVIHMKNKCLLSVLNVCWKYKGKYSKIVRSRPTWRYAMQYGWVRYLYQSGTLYQSGNNYFDDDIITRLSNYCFTSREIVTALENRIYWFSSPQEIFHFRILLLLC